MRLPIGVFYGAVAGAAATLVGLLFVALALKPAVMSDSRPAGLRVWAGQTFHSFLMVLVVALVALGLFADQLSFLVAMPRWGAATA